MQKIEPPFEKMKKEKKNLGDGGDIGSPCGAGGLYFLHKIGSTTYVNIIPDL